MHLAVTGRPDEMRVMWKTHSRSCPTKVHYGEGIMDEAGFDNAATLQNTLVSSRAAQNGTRRSSAELPNNGGSCRCETASCQC